VHDGDVHLAVVAEQLRAPVPGGTGRYTAELLIALRATARIGDRITDWYAPGGARLDRLRQPLVAELWRRGMGPSPHADCVFAPTLLVPPRRGRPLIATIHDAVPWTHPETLTARGARWHREMAERVADTADVVLTPTASVARELATHISLPRVEVIGEGVSEAIRKVPPDADQRAARLELPDSFALAVGTLEPRKGLDVAAAALGEADWPGLPLLVAGPGGWGDALPAAADPSQIRLLGRLADPDLATVYSRADVLVMASRAEGFGLPVLEAMSHGVPVVISDAPALVEVAGGAAIVTPRGDAPALAAAVSRAVAEREVWSKAGLVRSKDFSWEAAAVHLWEICRNLAST
jgi:glycosyltransferase involved in cell wall biosynthesis